MGPVISLSHFLQMDSLKDYVLESRHKSQLRGSGVTVEDEHM